MKRSLLLITALICTLFVGCSIDGTKTYIIASQKGVVLSPFNHWQSYFIVKEKGTNEWHSVDALYGMKYELGYEYIVEGMLATAQNYYEHGYIDRGSNLTIKTVISKTQKTTELPEQEMKEVERYLELLNSGQLPYEDTHNSEHLPFDSEDFLSQ